jgi:hypothetical protein
MADCRRAERVVRAARVVAVGQVGLVAAGEADCNWKEIYENKTMRTKLLIAMLALAIPASAQIQTVDTTTRTTNAVTGSGYLTVTNVCTNLWYTTLNPNFVSLGDSLSVAFGKVGANFSFVEAQIGTNTGAIQALQAGGGTTVVSNGINSQTVSNIVYGILGTTSNANSGSGTLIATGTNVVWGWATIVITGSTNTGANGTYVADNNTNDAVWTNAFFANDGAAANYVWTNSSYAWTTNAWTIFCNTNGSFMYYKPSFALYHSTGLVFSEWYLTYNPLGLNWPTPSGWASWSTGVAEGDTVYGSGTPYGTNVSSLVVFNNRFMPVTVFLPFVGNVGTYVVPHNLGYEPWDVKWDIFCQYADAATGWQPGDAQEIGDFIGASMSTSYLVGCQKWKNSYTVGISLSQAIFNTVYPTYGPYMFPKAGNTNGSSSTWAIPNNYFPFANVPGYVEWTNFVFRVRIMP